MIDVHFLNEFKIYHVYVHAIVDLKLVEKVVGGEKNHIEIQHNFHNF
jgi:hypothetical protein